LKLGPPKTLPRLFNDLPIVALPLEIRKVPAAAPPIIIISKGRALRMIPSLPPARMYPPKTMMKIRTMPMMANMRGRYLR
jgi:hypothetical protein